MHQGASQSDGTCSEFLSYKSSLILINPAVFYIVESKMDFIVLCVHIVERISQQVERGAAVLSSLHHRPVGWHCTLTSSLPVRARPPPPRPSAPPRPHPHSRPRTVRRACVFLPPPWGAPPPVLRRRSSHRPVCPPGLGLTGPLASAAGAPARRAPESCGDRGWSAHGTMMAPRAALLLALVGVGRASASRPTHPTAFTAASVGSLTVAFPSHAPLSPRAPRGRGD